MESLLIVHVQRRLVFAASQSRDEWRGSFCRSLRTHSDTFSINVQIMMDLGALDCRLLLPPMLGQHFIHTR